MNDEWALAGAGECGMGQVVSWQTGLSSHWRQTPVTEQQSPSATVGVG